MKIKVLDNDKCKIVKSDHYNSYFSKSTGLFLRYGRTLDDDPIMAPAWEILDWELSTKCEHGCKFCYKSNTINGLTIDLTTFKSTFDKLKSINPIWHQVAYGIGSLQHIPELPEMLQYTRNNGIIPNITINSNEFNCDVDDILQEIVYNCGAVSISDSNIPDTINLTCKLRSLMNDTTHLKQINVHHVISNQSFEKAFDMIDEMVNNPNIFTALVLLWIKEKGRAKGNYTQINDEQLTKLLDYAMNHNVDIGFDTCGSHHALAYYKSRGMESQVTNLIENCCSTRFSIYCDINGVLSPCSFCNDDDQYSVNIDRVTCAKDVWMSEEFMKFRKMLIDNELKCPIYEIDKRID